jgi:hypothetical protein
VNFDDALPEARGKLLWPIERVNRDDILPEARGKLLWPMEPYAIFGESQTAGSEYHFAHRGGRQ